MMRFEDDEEEEQNNKNRLELDSPKGSISSRSSLILFDEKQLLDDDDEFEDAVAVSVAPDEPEDAQIGSEQDKVTLSIEDDSRMMSESLNEVRIEDLDEERKDLPCARDPRIKQSALWTILKDCVGKDITKCSMPVVLNEPLTLLQRNSEVFAFNGLIEKALAEEDSLLRLVYISAYSAARYFLTNGRIHKPFNPLLGETFEIVTPTFRSIAEQVSHHPPVLAMHCQGQGYTISKTVNGLIKFTGKSITALDPNRFYLKIHPSCLKGALNDSEDYSFDNPKMMIGNLIIGDTYVEPQGATEIVNHSTGERCDLEFKPRGWTSQNKDSVFGEVRDSNGVPKYQIVGKYSQSMDVINVETQETWQIWKAPEQPESAERIYGMNNFALQLNLLSE